MTCYIYARVSKDEATFRCCNAEQPLRRDAASTCQTCQQTVPLTKPPSIEAQIERCRKYADLYAQGVPVVVVWEVVSGNLPMHKREQGGKLLEVIQPGDHFLTTKIDRSFRSLKDMCDALAKAERERWTIHFVDQKIDISDSTGRLLLHILAAFAEHEWHTISQRRKSMAQYRKGQELYNGGPVPTGKRVVFTDGQKRLEDDPAQAKLARILIREQQRRTPIPALLHFCNTHGYRNAAGQPYRRSALYRLIEWGKEQLALQNPLLLGVQLGPETAQAIADRAGVSPQR